MKLTTCLACFAFLAGTAISTLNDFTDLHPILAPSYDTAKLSNIVPSANATLNYGLDATMDPRSSVTIDLLADRPVVLLEAIGAVLKVACTYNTVTVSFSNAVTFEHAISEWPRGGGFYLITNHFENCDASKERGFYRVTSLSWDKEHASVTAQTEKTDFKSIATSLAVTFSHVQSSMQNNSGNITFNEPGISVASNFSLPTGMAIFSDGSSFSATANDGYLSDAALIRGYFSYDVPSSQLQNCWFDIDAEFFGDLAVTFNLTSPLSNNNYMFTPGTFFPSSIDVPSAFSLKPVLRWAVGADVGAAGAMYHDSNITMTIPDGHAHVDFLSSNHSHVAGWSPRLTSAVSTGEASTGHTSPFVDFTIELSLDILNGAFNTTGGITARPQFVNDLNVAQSQTRVRKANRMIWPRNATCSNGYEIRSSFNFTVGAYVTDQWQKTLYNTEIPIEDECISF